MILDFFLFPYTKKALKFSKKIVVNGLVKNHQKKGLVTKLGPCNKKQKIPSKMKILKDERKKLAQDILKIFYINFFVFQSFHISGRFCFLL